VSGEQVIVQAIKALRAGPLHSHLVRERPKIVLELYDQFIKFCKSEVQRFRKPEQQRKVTKPDEAPRARYGDNQRNYHKPVHNIGSDGCGPSENWNKILEHHCSKQIPGDSIRDPPNTTREAELQIVAKDMIEARTQ
jgi:hypothetical protein